jgi:hypothetical protein
LWIIHVNKSILGSSTFAAAAPRWRSERIAAAASHLCTMPDSRLYNMPDEVIHTIIAKLDDDMRAVLRLSQTSHRLASLASRPELWRKLLQDHWGAAAVAEFGRAASCPMTCLARTRLLPTVLRDAYSQTPLEPERFALARLSEYRILVEIMHEGRVVLTQVAQPATGGSYDENEGFYVFASHDGAPVSKPTRTTWHSSAPAAGAPVATWKEETEAFFNRGWDAHLCVVHSPSGRVVCLGVAGSVCRWAYPPEDTRDGKPPRPGGAELEFKWHVPTPLLLHKILDQIELGCLTRVNSLTGEELTT